MNKILFFIVLLLSTVSFSQCYNCNHDKVDQKRTHGPKRTFKKDFPGIKKVKWYTCYDEINYGVRDYTDSTITYIYSMDKVFLGKETRYYNMVTQYLTETKYEQPEYDELDNLETTLVKSLSPDILPKALWPEVAKIYDVEDLDTLNKVDGLPYWVCDIYKVEVPETNIIAQKEGTTTFYIANMDFIFSVFSESEEIHLANSLESHSQFYIEAEYIYE